MFNWFKILWQLNDEKLIEINGIDYTLYLVFLRYCAIFFAGLTIFNLIFMIPVYVTGSPTATPHLNSTMDHITVLNVSARSGKLAYTYFSSLILVSAGLMITLQKYRLKYDSWKKKRDPRVEFKTDADVAHYSIMVSRLP
jgi:hypothetical protein